MIVFIRLFVIATFSLSLSVQASISLPLEDGSSVDLYDKSYALLVGVSDYEHWPDLPGVEEDIALVGKSLKKHGFKVISLLNPTRTSFDETMRGFIGDYGQDPENRLIIYYAGHGYTLTTNRGRELGYIVPADTPLPKDGTGDFKKKAISMLEIEIFAKQMESKHAMFTFDSCFSGSLFEITRAVPDTISVKTAEPVRQFITAGSAEQTVPDKSVFRSQFVAGLEGEADVNKDGFITGTELAQYIEESVTNYTRRAQTPQYGKIRDPYLDKGDFVFINPKIEITIKVQGEDESEKSGLQTVDPAAVELSYWDAIKNTQDPEAYQAYLDEYPEGQFSKLATLLIKQAAKQEEKNRALKLEREEQQRQQAQQRAIRDADFERQQELLAQQQRDNEQRIAAFKEEQIALAEQREAEEVRLKELLAQQKMALEQQALAKSQTQLASVSPATVVASASENTSKYLFVVLAERQTSLKGYKGMDDQQYTSAMADQLIGNLRIAGIADQQIQVIKDYELGKEYSYESNDYEVGQRLCKQYGVDKIVSAMLENDDDTIVVPHPATFIIYGCKTNEKVIETRLTDNFGRGQEKLLFSTDMKQFFRRFLRDFEHELLNDS